MFISAVIAVFSVENVADIFLSKYIQFEFEIGVWIAVAIISGAILYEVGEDRGDW